jgi:hypothetical protein
MREEGYWKSWLQNAHDVKAQYEDVRFFCAIEVDSRGKEFFKDLTDELDAIGGEYFFFSLDDKRTSVDTANRLRHITMGQNIATQYACDEGASHLLFVAADTVLTGETLPKLLELDTPLCGAEIPTYCLNGQVVQEFAPIPVQEQLISAACILIRRDVFEVLRWRYGNGMSDDPAYRHDALTLLGVKSYVRKDVIVRHYPECIPPIEYRHSAQWLEVQR